MKKILIIGASSGIGLQTVKNALANGYHVRAFARSADKIDINHDNLEKFTGDALESKDVEKAIQNIDVVIQTLGVPFDLTLITGPISLFSKSTKILLQVMTENSIRRLITITGFGAGRSRSSINIFQRIGFEMIFGRAYGDKDKQEQLIENSGLDWTIVRPGMLTNGTSKAPNALIESNEWRNGYVSRATVASFLIQQIESRDLICKSPVLVN